MSALQMPIAKLFSYLIFSNTRSSRIPLSNVMNRTVFIQYGSLFGSDYFHVEFDSISTQGDRVFFAHIRNGDGKR